MRGKCWGCLAGHKTQHSPNDPSVLWGHLWGQDQTPEPTQVHRKGKSLPHYCHHLGIFISTQRSQLGALPLLSALPQGQALGAGWPQVCGASVIQISKPRCWEVSAQPASAPGRGCKCSHCSPGRAGSCRHSRAEYKLPPHLANKHPPPPAQHSPPGRSIAEPSPRQAELSELQAAISSFPVALLPCSL